MAVLASNPPAENQTVISQDEIERLLAQMGEGDAPLESDDLPAGRTSPLPKSDNVKRHVFPQFSFFSASELRKLRVRHEQFIRSLAAQLSLYLRLEFGLQMSRLETVPYQKFVDSLANPVHVTVFKLEPLRGTCLLEISPRLAVGIVDRQLGGTGRSADESRDLSEIEGRLLGRFLEIIIGEWCSFWSSVLDLRPVTLATETNSRSLHTSAPETTMLILGMEARLGETVEQIQFAFPSQALEPLLLKLNNQHDHGNSAAAENRNGTLAWNSTLSDLKIPVTAEIPLERITARQLAELKPGSFIPIGPDMVSRVAVRLGKKAKFTATLGTCGQRWSAKINEVLK